MTIWWIARALGLVALLALTSATALGAVSTRGGVDRRSRDRRTVVQLAHRSSALVGLSALVLHVVLLVLDTHVDLTIGSVLVPFTSGFAPLGVGLGVLALWAFVAAAASGALRGRLAGTRVSPRVWRAVHLSGYAGWALSLGHGLLTGTDTGTWWSSATYALCAAFVGGAVLLRLAGTRRSPATTDRGSRAAGRELLRGAHS